MAEEKMTLVERLRNPSWVHGPDLERAILDTETTVSDMREAAETLESAKPQRYNIATDEMVEVTQEWVHDVETMFNKFGAARGHARSFLKSHDANPEGTRKAIQAFMDAWKPEFG